MEAADSQPAEWTIKIFRRRTTGKPPQLVKIKWITAAHGISSLMPQIRRYLQEKDWWAEKYFFYRRERQIWVLLTPKDT